MATAIAGEKLGLLETEAALERQLPKTPAGNELCDLAYQFLSIGVRAGYLLGLAVGQQLGPGAFGGVVVRR